MTQESPSNPPAPGSWFARSRLLSALLILLVLAASVLVLTLPEADTSSWQDKPVEGQYAPSTVRSTLDFSLENEVETRRLRDQEIKDLPAHFLRQPEHDAQIRSFFTTMITVTLDSGAAKARGESYSLPKEIADTSLRNLADAVLSFDPELLRYLRAVFDNPEHKKAFLQRLEDVLSQGVLREKIRGNLLSGAQLVVRDFKGRFSNRKLDELPAPREAAGSLSNDLFQYFPGREKETFKPQIRQIFTDFLQEGNLLPDQEADRLAEEEILARPPVMHTFGKDQNIVLKDSKLTAEDVRVLTEYKRLLGLQKTRDHRWDKLAERIALCIALMIFTCIYVTHIHPEVVTSNRSLWLLGSIAIIALVANRFSANMYRFFSDQGLISPQLLFLALPLGLPALMISVIYGLRSALYVGLYVSGVAAIGLGNSFQVFLTGLLVSGIGGYAVRHVTDYKKFFVYAFLGCGSTSLVSALIFFGLTFRTWDQWQQALLVPISCGLFTALVALVAIFTLESLFDISSNMSFLTSTDRNHPLLKRLLLEAPGTYHHSERVASMAERAASAIHANPLMVQVCAIFHDIGKLSAPEMFTENSGGIDTHKGLPPEQSVAIIRKHVEYGIELARKYKLRRIVREAIAQHHGTDFISFFYNLARQNGDVVRESDFRYAGPLPSQKEIVILMLADCAEAAPRSLKNPTPEAIRAQIDDIFEKKLHHGQLAAAQISIAELNGIKESFVNTLISMGHSRIAYPDQEETE